MWLLKYPTGSHIPPHQDIIDGYSHTRINILLWMPSKGGIFNCNNCRSIFNRIFIFRSDLEEHSVSEILEGSRVAISIGIFKRL